MTQQKNKEGKHRRINPYEMTLDDIRMKLIINSMKIKMERRNLMTAITPGATPFESAMASNLGRMETFMEYATVGVTVYRMVKNAVNFFRSFKKSS